MVSLYPNPPSQDFDMADPTKMGLLPGGGFYAFPPTTMDATNTAMPTAGNANADSGFVSEDPNKKVRKPYTITKSRESWTDQEHDKFLEALQLFDRDWKKIEAFVGSKTVIQIRSHAQKYFLKVQKNGTSEHVPPPRPKRKAAHPYPQKATKNASQVAGPFQCSSGPLERGHPLIADSSSVSGNLAGNAALSPWTCTSVPLVNVSQFTKDDAGLIRPAVVRNCCSSSDESTRVWPTSVTNDHGKGKHNKPVRVIPDFAQVYRFIGSVFDPDARGHLERLKKMDPINVETVLLLMRNLAINLMSPEFEDHRRFLSSCDPDFEKFESRGLLNKVHAGEPKNAIPTM